MEFGVGRLAMIFACPPDERVRIRAQWDRDHCLRLPRFVAHDLLTTVRQRLAEGAPVQAEYEHVGRESAFAFGRSTAALELVMNDDRLFQAIQLLTGTGPLGCFVGRIYEMEPGSDGFGWHDDVESDRQIGLTVNLGVAPFDGGALQIAEAASKRIVSEVVNVGAGDAVIFRIGSDLVHRVTPVVGSAPKIAYSGWFCSRPSYREVLRDRWQSVGRQPSP